MTDELELLRDVVRALVAQRRAFTFLSETMRRRMETGERPTDETINKMKGADYAEYEKAVVQALARLAEVNPDLVNG